MEKPKLNFEDSFAQDRRQGRLKESEDFLEAKIPFEYKYTFPGGENLEAFQSNRGGGFIVIRRGKEIIFDFSKLLPEGWKFVTPTYFKKHPKESVLDDYSDSSWAVDQDRKIVFLGYFHEPQELFILLHEIGHSVTGSLEEDIKISEVENEFGKTDYTGDIENKVLLSEELAKLESKSERNAHAYALRALKDIQKKTSVDLKSLFPTFNDLKKYINESLASYRQMHEWIIKEGYDEEFYKELQKMFDKWQYE